MHPAYLFIFNQEAGTTVPKETINRINQVGREAGVALENIYTIFSSAKSSTHLLIDRFAKDHPDGLVVACGGDGTAYYVGNEVIKYGLTLAILPFGTGNDLYKTLYPNRSIDAQIMAIFNGQTAETDAIYIEELDVYSLNIATVGADAHVVRIADTYRKRLPAFRKYSYMMAIPQAVKNHLAEDIVLSAYMEEKLLEIKAGPYTIAASCNGKFYGGGFQVNPMGTVEDGLIHLIYIPKIALSRIPGLLIKFFKGQYLDAEGIYHVTCDKIVYEARPGKKLLFNMDGEMTKLPKVTLKIAPKVYKRIV